MNRLNELFASYLLANFCCCLASTERERERELTSIPHKVKFPVYNSIYLAFFFITDVIEILYIFFKKLIQCVLRKCHSLIIHFIENCV